MLDVAIVGGGLSGLLVALEIHTKNNEKTWTLFEARPTVGGRLENDRSGRCIDLGGAWIWPGNQPSIRTLANALRIRTFPQPDDPSSHRLVGGAAEIPRRIAERVPRDRVRIDSPVLACRLVVPNDHDADAAGRGYGAVDDDDEPHAHVVLELASGESVRARRVVLAAPPKLVSLRVGFDPPLPASKVRAMSSSQTWMAGVTKVSLVFKSPRFWPLYESNRGFRPGPNEPAFQVYDASPPESETESVFSALTFFALASLASDDDAALADACAEQMSGSVSSTSVARALKRFDEYHVKRWPKERYISEEENPRGINPHPSPVLELSKSEWGGRLLFAGTETDQKSPGVMDGAVGAAMRAADELRNVWANNELELKGNLGTAFS